MNWKLYCAGFIILPFLALHAQWDNAPTFALPDRFVSLYAEQPKPGRIPVFLGFLGNGVIESERNTAGHIVCGTTGNCPTSLVFRWHGHDYRKNLGSGWAYAVIPTQRSIPDIVLMANMSAESGQAVRFGFIDGTYVETGCDYVETKEGTKGSLDSGGWIVEPC
jgi:hypothetical protein